MRTLLYTTLISILISSCLTQGRFFDSKTCNTDSLNLQFIQSEMRQKIEVLNRSIPSPGTHPCASFFGYGGSCCNLNSLKETIDKLPQKATEYFSIAAESKVAAFQYIYAPYLYSLGAEKLRAKVPEGRLAFNFLSEFVELVSLKTLDQLVKIYYQNARKVAEYALDFSADAFCRLCAADDSYKQHTIQMVIVFNLEFLKKFILRLPKLLPSRQMF